MGEEGGGGCWLVRCGRARDLLCFVLDTLGEGEVCGGRFFLGEIFFFFLEIWEG